MAFGFKQRMHIIINACAAVAEKNDSLIDDVSCATKISDEKELLLIKDYIEESKQAKILYKYVKTNPLEIKNPEMIKVLMRENWFTYFLIKNIDEVDNLDFKQILKSKSELEKLHDEKIGDRMFGQYSILQVKDEKKKDLEEFVKELMPYKEMLRDSLVTCSNYFDIIGMPYMGDIYAEDILGKIDRPSKGIGDGSKRESSGPIISVGHNNDSRKHKEQKGSINNRPTGSKKAANIPPKEEIDEPIISVEFLAEVEEKLKGFKAQITYLEKSNHEKEVLLSHAEKDALRKVMGKFCDLSYGCPLGELFRYWKSDEPNNAVKRIISNLYLSLADADIHTYKEQLINSTIQITKENAGLFTIESGDELKQGDEVIVKYPGFRLGQEVIVKPFAYKKGNSKNG